MAGALPLGSPLWGQRGPQPGRRSGGPPNPGARGLPRARLRAWAGALPVSSRLRAGGSGQPRGYPGGPTPRPWALVTPEARVARVSARKALPGSQAPWVLHLLGLLGVRGVGSGTDSGGDGSGSTTAALGGGCSPLRKLGPRASGGPAGDGGPACRMAKRAPMRYWVSWVSGGSSQMVVGARARLHRALRPPHMGTGGVIII